MKLSPMQNNHSSQALEALKAGTKGVGNDAEATAKSAAQNREMSRFREAAQEFESMFLNLVIGSMRQTVVKGGLIDGGNAEGIYQSMLDIEYSKSLAEQNMTGLAEALERQLIDRKSLAKPLDFAPSKQAVMDAYLSKKLP